MYASLITLDATVLRSSLTRDAIVAVWVPPVVLDNDHVLHTLGAAGGLVANLRTQILANGLPGVAAFCRGVREAARGSDGGVEEITQEVFHAAASSAGAALTVSFLGVELLC